MKKKFLIIVIAIILVISAVVAVFLLRNQSSVTWTQTQTMIDVHNTGMYVMADYAYAYGINTDTNERYIDCIDYADTKSAVRSIPVSEPAEYRIENEDGLEYWIWADMCMDNEERLVCLYYHNYAKRTEDNQYIASEMPELWLYFYDTKGTFEDKIMLDESLYDKGYESDSVDIEQGKEGDFYLLSRNTTQGGSIVFTLSEDGTLKSTLQLEEGASLYKTADGYTVLKNGKEIMILEAACPYKDEADKIKADEIISCFYGSEYAFVYMKGQALHGVTYEGVSQKLMEQENAQDIGIWKDKIYREGEFYRIESNVDGNTYIMNWSKEGDVQSQVNDEREIIYLATVADLTESEFFIQNFNQNNQDYKIEVVSYYEEADPEKALAEDIVTGSQQIDIMDLSEVDKEVFIEKDLLVDIYEYIEGDEEFQLEDFDTDIFKAYETDGALYSIVPAYYIGGMLTDNAKTDALGGWSYEAMWQMALEVPESQTDYEMFYYSLMAHKDSLYNVDAGTCDLTGIWIRDVLTNGRVLSGVEQLESRDVMNRLSTCGFTSCIMSFRDLTYLSAYNANGAKISLRGIPGENGEIYYIRPAQEFGICANSIYKEAAWEVCRQMLTREYQVKVGYSSGAFVTRPDAMEQLYRTILATEGYEDDILGYVEPYSGNSAFGVTLENVTLGPVKEGDLSYVEDIKGYLYAEPYRETVIYSMMWEEAQLFYAGTGSADNTINTMENKISLYLSE